MDTNLHDVVSAHDALEEATRRGNQRRKMERLIRPLEMKLRRAFRSQGSALASKFRQVRRFFSESEDPWKMHDAWLNMKFEEALPPSEFNAIWAQIVLETAKLFSLPIDEAIEKALELGGIAMIAELGLKINFDLKNPRAEDYLRDYGADLVTGINETTRDLLQTLLNQAADEGWSYKKTMEAILERFDDFSEYRARLIAVTELGNAYEEGNRIVAKDLEAAGLAMEKSWSTVGDAKVSDGCRENEEAGWIGLDAAFPSGHLRPLRFPGCRCECRYQRKR